MADLRPSAPAVASARVRPRWLKGPVLATVVALVALDAPRGAEAAWPPPANATADVMKDPANWPNDPEYGFDVASKQSGQWELYSFIPDRADGAPALRSGETASGMSIDLAWRNTRGDDRILIAVMDSGIRWHETELLEKAYLNKGELVAHQPRNADDTACAPLDPTKPTEDLFDCNGDGFLSVADYADDPRLPAAVGGRPPGDANQNGEFDAGDLIVMPHPTSANTRLFSDGIDDDGNGYVDDISGWDFMKNDNDPFDDTSYGHGTSQARDSVGATNNGVGAAGVCPHCRFLPMRVGDSFIAEVQDFAKGVAYAVDNGASVIQSALGTIDMSSFAQSALDYAWARGVVVVASMADENARHHNVPTVANHTMPVHAITMLMAGGAPDSTKASSFYAYNTCSNFGAHNFLSASASPCSSEAVAKLAGISGLVYAEALESKLTPPLRAGEVLQLFQMTTDDISVPESQEPTSRHFWSQEGFDQRFGYGRINANRAVEWVTQGKIPPDIDIVRPYWYEVLYPDEVTGAVPIRGTIHARRASAYDFSVEWAPGVQPLDSEFTQIRQMQNVPGSTVMGEDGEPLAELEVRSIELDHERDVDSPLGENDFTITVRVRATAKYDGAGGEVPGELRRAYYVHRDPDLLNGFPVHLGASGESSPKLADIDGDGLRDIVVGTGDGKLHVLSLRGEKPEPVSGFPFLTKKHDGLDTPGGALDYSKAPAYSNPDGLDTELAREAIVATPAIADVDGDGKLDIAITTYQGTLYVVNSDGSVHDGWPVGLPPVPSCPVVAGATRPELCTGIVSVKAPNDTSYLIARGAFASPVLADLNGDAKLEIIQAAFDGFVHVFEADGTPLEGWPVRIHYPEGKEYNRIITTPAVADFNGDGTPDILVGSNEKLGSGGGAGGFYMVDGRGTKAGATPYFPNWPISMVSFKLFPLVAEGTGNAPIAADMTGDGIPEGIMHGNASAPLILPLDPGPDSLSTDPPNKLPERVDPISGEPARGILPTSIFGADSKGRLPDVMLPLFAQPSAGDLDQDGVPDIVSSGGSLSMAQDLLSSQARGEPGQQLLTMWNGKTGAMMPGSPVVIEDFTFFNNQAIVDLTGDGYPEVLTGTGGYYVHAADACGREAQGWPKFTGQWVSATPAVGDLDGDDSLEVVVNTRNGWLYAWRSGGRTDGVIAWESYHHDNRNTGYVGTPLEQGKLLGAPKPLEVDADGSCVVPKSTGKNVEAAGGCDCRSAPGGATRAFPLLLLWPAIGLLARRRRAGQRPVA